MTVITGPGELVALVPRILGFHPRDSVVTVLLGPRGAVLSALRVDRPALLAQDGRDLAVQVAAQAARDGAARAIVLGFTSTLEGARCPATDRVADALADAVGEVISWRVAGGRYTCPDCTDPRCCPPGGLPVPTLAPGVAVARWRDRTAPDLRGAAAEERRKCVRAAQRWAARASAMDPDRWREASLAAWRAALSDGGTGAAVIGRVAAGLADVRVRDAALLTLIPGAERAAEDACAGIDSAAVAAALGTGLLPAAPPDEERTESAVRLLDGVLDHLAGGRAAPAAGMLAVVAWWRSDPDAAVAWCEVALGLDPGYRLATLVLALVDAVDRG